jgi:alkylhydroperoxidase family enzyme
MQCLRGLGLAQQRRWARPTSGSSRWPHGGRPPFSDAERAALALTEAATRLADRPDPVPDQIWNEAAKHYEKALAAILLMIATTNIFNRLNVTTRQLAGAWG